MHRSTRVIVRGGALVARARIDLIESQVVVLIGVIFNAITDSVVQYLDTAAERCFGWN